jgi:CRISPR/Cas system-associated exonuclease Cas4 (RecB family)
LSIHWRRFGKLDLNEREAIVWISEKQRIKVSIDYADEEDIQESFLSLNHFLQKRPEWALDILRD